MYMALFPQIALKSGHYGLKSKVCDSGDLSACLLERVREVDKLENFQTVENKD